MVSRPNRSASTVNATSSRTAKRTLISAVVSCSRTSTWPSRIDRAAPETTMPVTATSPANAPSTTTLAPVLPPEAEKNRDSSTIAAKSAMLAAARAVCPHLAVHLAGVLEHRDDQAERGGRQRDRQQQRL